jgi:hypothetical protein
MITGSFTGGRTTGGLGLSLSAINRGISVRHVVGSVFGIEQQPIEPGEAENFGGDRVRKRTPAANEAFAGKDALTKSVRETGVGHRGKESEVAGVQELQEVNTYITSGRKVIVSGRLQLFHSATPDS